jgi:hypothetical protein
MQLKQLSNDRVKQLENITERFENVMSGETYDKVRETVFLKNGLYSWFHKYGLEAGKLNSHVKKLTEIFGVKQNYYATYYVRYAVWGFEWQGNEFLFYKSTEGITIQILPEFPNEQFEQFFTELRDLLYSK